MLKSKIRPTGVGAIVAGLVLLALPRAAADAQARDAPGFQTAVFAGGCFWSEEKAFDGLPGVRSAVSGFVGGHRAIPPMNRWCAAGPAIWRRSR